MMHSASWVCNQRIKERRHGSCLQGFPSHFCAYSVSKSLRWLFGVEFNSQHRNKGKTLVNSLDWGCIVVFGSQAVLSYTTLHLHSVSPPCCVAWFCLYFSWKYMQSRFPVSPSSPLLCHLEAAAFFCDLSVCLCYCSGVWSQMSQLSHPISVFLLWKEQSQCTFHQFRHRRKKKPPVRLKTLQITVGSRMKPAPEFCFTDSLPSLFLSHSSLTHLSSSVSPHVTFLPLSSFIIPISFLSLPMPFSSAPHYCGSLYATKVFNYYTNITQ